MKILHLVLYSDNRNYYYEMYKLLSPFYKEFKSNVTTLFYKYNETIQDDFMIENDILHIKGGPETRYPGLLEKTIKALEYICSTNIIHNYDYVLRTDGSTIVNFDLLFPLLRQNPIKFYGGILINNLEWLDYPSGIFDTKWFGTLYVSGSNIIWTKQSVQFMIENKTNLHYELVDDLSIGILMQEKTKNDPERLANNGFIHVPPFVENSESLHHSKLIDMVKSNKHIVYKNKNYLGDQRIDVIQMKIILETILKHRNLALLQQLKE